MKIPHSMHSTHMTNTLYITNIPHMTTPHMYHTHRPTHAIYMWHRTYTIHSHPYSPHLVCAMQIHTCCIHVPHHMYRCTHKPHNSASVCWTFWLKVLPTLIQHVTHTTCTSPHTKQTWCGKYIPCTWNTCTICPSPHIHSTSHMYHAHTQLCNCISQ